MWGALSLEQLWTYAVMTQIECYMDWKDVEGKFHDQFEVQIRIEQMLGDDVVT
jgi:hypothetical protein